MEVAGVDLILHAIPGTVYVPQRRTENLWEDQVAMVVVMIKAAVVFGQFGAPLGQFQITRTVQRE